MAKEQSEKESNSSTIEATKCEIISMEDSAVYRGTVFNQYVELKLENGIKLTAFDQDMVLRDNKEDEIINLALAGFITQKIRPSNEKLGVKLTSKEKPSFHLVGELQELSENNAIVTNPHLNLEISRTEIDNMDKKASKGDRIKIPIDRLDIKGKV